MNKSVYIYDGPVLEFGRVITQRWQGRTVAVSEAKARSNLTYQYKQATGRVPATKITLPGNVKEVDYA